MDISVTCTATHDGSGGTSSNAPQSDAQFQGETWTTQGLIKVIDETIDLYSRAALYEPCLEVPLPFFSRLFLSFTYVSLYDLSAAIP